MSVRAQPAVRLPALHPQSLSPSHLGGFAASVSRPPPPAPFGASPARRGLEVRSLFEALMPPPRTMLDPVRQLGESVQSTFGWLADRAAELYDLDPGPALPPLAENPKVASKRNSDQLVYGEVEGAALFIDGIHHDDFRQTSLGNCGFLASLSSVAAARPDLIEDMITDHGDGTYTIAFYGDDGVTRTGIRVDDALPLSPDGKPAYTQPRERGELWLSLIEKAYAIYRGGSYDAIESQSPALVMTHLVGGRKSVYGTKNGDDTLYRQLETALSEGRFVVAGTFPIQDDPKTPEVEQNDPAFVVPHAYSVLGVEEVDGERFVILRNPWGRQEWGKDGKDDGTFRLPLHVFTDQFGYADVVGGP